MKNLLIPLAFILLLAACDPVPENAAEMRHDNATMVKRVFNPVIDGRWIGNGISYGAWRDGEGPDSGVLTSKENILEDLQIISKRWNLIRLYGSGKQSENILQVILDHKLPIRVMQGAWISKHQTPEENDDQVNRAIELANSFPGIIVAVNVGNEIFVDWSWHRIDDMDKVIGFIRDVRSRIKQPVTVNDDYNFWNKDHSKKIADEVDFIGLHAYAFWNNKPLEEAMDWTESIYRDIQDRHPGHLIAYCESGWPTSRVYDTTSYEGKLIGKAGEDEQKIFFDQYDAWVNENKIISLYFEAFDENWKGGFDGENPMAKAEKHWGVYKADRTPKRVLQ